ncbi:MAG: porin [Nitrosomonadaceae bacterium]|nr:porin [Nitrosomonadaceae bacterium]
MKKKLIALAVAGALAAPVVASAQGTNVTIFGRVQAEYSGVDNGNTPYQSGISDNARSSRWGLQITEDLGRGLKANARFEQGFNTGSGQAATPREQWVGLSSAQWGDVKFGRVQSPFKDFAGGMTIDPFAYTTLQANGAGATMTGSANGMGSGANGFVNGAIRFDSISTEGFSFAGLLMPGDANQFDPTINGNATNAWNGGGAGNTGGKDGEFDGQVAGKYVTNYMGHDLSMFGGYSRDNANATQKMTLGVRTEETWRIGGTWKYDNLSVVGQYERVYNALGAATCTSASALAANPLIASSGQCNSAMNSGGDGDIWHVGTNYKWGNTLLVAQGGKTNADAIGTTAARDATSFTVGAIHSLSKRTSLFGGYQRVTQGLSGANASGGTTGEAGHTAGTYGAGNRNTWTVGMRHNF